MSQRQQILALLPYINICRKYCGNPWNGGTLQWGHQQLVQICCHRTINHGTPPARDATHTRTPGPGLKELQGMMLQGVSIDASTKGVITSYSLKGMLYDFFLNLINLY